MTMPAHSPSALPTMEYGRVAGRRCNDWVVLSANGRYTARRAKSCLLAPDVGDSVLLCTDELGVCFILAVLEGATDMEKGSKSVLECEGDLELRVTDGSLSVAADREIQMVSDELNVSARSGAATLESLSLLAENFKGQCRNIALAADVCQQSLRSLTQRLGSLFRSTEGHEEIQAGSARTMVEDVRVLHCKNSVLMAEEDARIDAEQIQLG